MNHKSMSEVVIEELGYEKVAEIPSDERWRIIDGLIVAETVDEYPRSQGHISFVPDTERSHWEYFVRGDSIYRASIHAPVMPDNYRSGRWYCYATPERIENLRRHLPWHA